MTRQDFIATMKAQVEILKTERSEFKKMIGRNDEAYHKYNKRSHEISAIENAIKEMERI